LRYYKHMTDMLASADGQRVLRECGYGGYGRLHAIMEAVAGNTKPGKPFEMTRRTSWWMAHLETTSSGLRSLLRSCERRGEDAGLLSWSEAEGQLTIAMPKLAKYRDEYRRKSGQTSGQCPDKYPERLPPSEVRGKRNTPKGVPDGSDGAVLFDTETDHPNSPPSTCGKSLTDEERGMAERARDRLRERSRRGGLARLGGGQ